MRRSQQSALDLFCYFFCAGHGVDARRRVVRFEPFSAHKYLPINPYYLMYKCKADLGRKAKASNTFDLEFPEMGTVGAEINISTPKGAPREPGGIFCSPRQA